jgi:hypothetical protein
VLLASSGDGTLSAHDLRSRTVLAHSESDADDELLSGGLLGGGGHCTAGRPAAVPPCTKEACELTFKVFNICSLAVALCSS